MTPLKPIENLRVRGVASERYPINAKCAHPECNEIIDGVHHCFPKSQIGNDSYFVEIEQDMESDSTVVIPHAVGLCGSGTTGHHGAVEAHDAWIKYEDGEFVWYDRPEGRPCLSLDSPDWIKLGPLNPQPGSREGKPKRKKFAGEARRQRKTVSIKVPQDEQEDGAGLLDEQLELAGELLVKLGLYPEPPPVYFRLMAALVFFNNHAGVDA